MYKYGNNREYIESKQHLVVRKCGKEYRNTNVPCQLVLTNTVFLSISTYILVELHK